MTLTDRDRKILVVLVPLLVLAAYWFLVLSPKRQEAAELGEQLTQVESDRDAAVAQAQQVSSSRQGFKQDYAAMVTLGKAIPSTVDMPSLLVQLDRAAAGTDIEFDRVSAGERVAATAPAGDSGTSPQGDAAAGGTPASTGAGQAAEQADAAGGASDARNAAAGADAPAGSTSAPTVLDSVPLEFTFTGSFFRLADFFHDLKRFVHLRDDGVHVNGRLMTINSLILKPAGFPRIEAQVTATVFLSPKAQGTTAGATPQGPQDAQPATAQPAQAADNSTSTATPTAAAAR
jgi:type II secretion system (T2SS) protein M